MSSDLSPSELDRIQKALDAAFWRTMRNMAKKPAKPKNRKHRRHGGKAR